MRSNSLLSSNNSIRSNNLLIVKNINLISSLYVVIWVISPPLTYGAEFRVAAVFFAGIWLLTALVLHAEYFVRFQTYLFFSILLIAKLMLSRVFFASEGPISVFVDSLQLIILLFCGTIADYYSKYLRKYLIILFWTIVICVTIFSVTTILREDVYSTRNAGGVRYETDAAFRAAIMGVGGFGFVYFTALLAPLLLYYWLSSSTDRKTKGLVLVTFIVQFAAVLSALYVISVILLLISTVLVFFLRKLTPIRFILLVFLSVAIPVLVVPLSESIFEFLVDALEGTPVYARKLLDLQRMLRYEVSSGSIATRLDSYSASLTSIIKYPLFGSIAMTGEDLSGHHSAILDIIAAHGWLSASIFLYLMVFYPLKIMRISKHPVELRMLFFLSSMTLCLLNPVTSHYGLVLIVYLSIALVIEDKTRQIEDSVMSDHLEPFLHG